MLRKLFGITCAALLLSAGTANAAPLPANLSLTVAIQNIGSVSISGTGTVDVTGGTLTVPAALTLATTVNLPVTTTTAVVSVIGKAGIDQLAATFSPAGAPAGEICPMGVTPRACVAGGGNLQGAMALSGTVSVNLGGGVIIPINLGAALIGLGGTTIQPPVTGFFFENGVWTNGTAVVQFTTATTGTTLVLGMTFSNMGTANSILSSMGTGSLAGNQVTLVTPTFVLALGNKLPVFASFTVSIIPEPGTLLLLGTGIVGLAAVGRRSRKQ